MVSASDEVTAKAARLHAVMATFAEGVAVAFSGGIDSTVVAKAAHDVLGARALAVTADSPSVARRELADAVRLASLIGIRHHVMATREFTNPEYLRNDGNRCYFCKTELYDQITALLPELGVPAIVSGANLDDRGDFRPGLTAAAEHQVRHPLQEAGFTKADVRAVAQLWNLPTWDKPAAPCLSSRVAPGVAVTPERTARIEAAEDYLRGLGFRECRVRLHEQELARIEVPLSEVARLTEPLVLAACANYLRQLGFQFVTLDLLGLRSGSMNDLISLAVKAKYQQGPAMTHAENDE